MKTNTIHSAFQLIGHTVSTINIKNDFVQIDQNSEYKKVFDLSHRIMSISDSGKGYYLGLLELTTIATVSKAKEKYKAKIILEGMFMGQKDAMDEEAFKDMLNVNGIAALYSVVRSTLISISAQTLSHGTITLPMINVFEYSRNAEEE